MKKCPNEERMAKKRDLEKMRARILKEDRKEDDKRYALNKRAKRKK